MEWKSVIVLDFFREHEKFTAWMYSDFALSIHRHVFIMS